MALDKVIDSTKLNASLTAEANAIRAKSGDSAQIAFDFANSKGFADAIAAIPSGGDPYDIVKQLFNGTLTYFSAKDCQLFQSAFSEGSSYSTTSYLPNLSFFSIRDNTRDTDLSHFRNLGNLLYCNLGKTGEINNNCFNRTILLKSLIITSNSVATLSNTNAFTSSGIADGTGYIWVKDSLVSSYKRATNWSTYAAQIKGFSEAPAYSTSTTYNIGDVCKYNNKFYGYCKEDLTSATGQAPTGTTEDNTYWEYIYSI